MKSSVLIVEDDRDMAEMLELILSADFNVSVCTEKTHAIRLAKEHLTTHGAPDIMVIDLIINGEGGLDLYQWMHENDFYPPVIFLTGCHQHSPEFVAAVETGERVYEKDNFSSARLAEFIRSMVADTEGQEDGQVSL